MRSLETLLQPVKPWVLRYHGPRDVLFRPLERLASEREGSRLIVLEGSAMPSIEDAYDELTRKFAFPDYFGRNLDALDECLTDLTWLPATTYVVAVCDCEQMLRNQSITPPEALVDAFQSCGESWSRPVARGEWWDRLGIPFHTILQFSNPSPDPPAFARDIPAATI